LYFPIRHYTREKYVGVVLKLRLSFLERHSGYSTIHIVELILAHLATLYIDEGKEEGKQYRVT